MNNRRLERDEIGRLGSSIYEKKLRDQLVSCFHGQFVAIDVESGEYEIDVESSLATERLWQRFPESLVYVERIGYPAAFHAFAVYPKLQ